MDPRGVWLTWLRLKSTTVITDPQSTSRFLSLVFFSLNTRRVSCAELPERAGARKAARHTIPWYITAQGFILFYTLQRGGTPQRRVTRISRMSNTASQSFSTEEVTENKSVSSKVSNESVNTARYVRGS